MTWDPYDAPCHRDYFPASKNISGPRDIEGVKIVVWHNTVTDDLSADGVARFFRDVEAAGSTQVTVDSAKCQRSVPDDDRCQGARSNSDDWANTHGLHMEYCSQVWWNPKTWFNKHRRMMKRGAFRTAMWCFKHDIPPRWLGPEGIRAGKKGITNHYNITRAFHVSGGHTDKGPPRFRTMRLVKRYYKRIVEARER